MERCGCEVRGEERQVDGGYVAREGGEEGGGWEPRSGRRAVIPGSERGGERTAASADGRDAARGDRGQRRTHPRPAEPRRVRSRPFRVSTGSSLISDLQDDMRDSITRTSSEFPCQKGVWHGVPSVGRYMPLCCPYGLGNSCRRSSPNTTRRTLWRAD